MEHLLVVILTSPNKAMKAKNTQGDYLAALCRRTRKSGYWNALSAAGLGLLILTAQASGSMVQPLLESSPEYQEASAPLREAPRKRLKKIQSMLTTKLSTYFQ